MLQPGKRIASNLFTRFSVQAVCSEGFHSLQTGKRITSSTRNTIQSALISFHSLQTGNAYPKFHCPETLSLVKGFHSLQTGTRIQRISSPNNCQHYREVSIPLQTGTRITSMGPMESGIGSYIIVSIPFKRERVSQVTFMIGMLTHESRFHSLQTGNRIPKASRVEFEKAETLHVSIPFKRESAFQGANHVLSELSEYFEFPFPSNGKVHSKPNRVNSFYLWQVRFHSLQTGKCIPRYVLLGAIPFGDYRFHSLQTGKCIPRMTITATYTKLSEFPFPSNGKVHSKYTDDDAVDVRDFLKFQFPSNGKSAFQAELGTGTSRPIWYRSFNSLQTGKVHSKLSIARSKRTISLRSFNSLQTGKCIPRASAYHLQRAGYICFNSLQTGKCIPRGNSLTYKIGIQVCFNSLQTGKCIPSGR